MTEQSAGRDASPPVRADGDASDPSTTRGTGDSADAAARAAGESGSPPGRAAAEEEGAVGGDPAPSVPADGTLGRTYAAALGSSAAEPGPAAPAPEPSAGHSAPVPSSASVVPGSLRPEPQPDPALAPAPVATAAQTDTAPAVAEAAAEAVAVGATEADPRDRLGRPGSPALAFAAIAGVVLMATPFAVNETSQRLPGTEIGLADQEGVLGYFMRADTGANGEATVTAEQQSPAGASASGLVTGVEERPAPDSGYVPEVLPQEEPEQGGAGDAEDPASDGAGSGPDASPEDGSSGSSGGEGSEAPAEPDTSGDGPMSGGGGDDDEEEDDEDEDTRGSDSGPEGESGDSGGSGDDGASLFGASPDSNTNGPLPLADPQDSDEDEDTDAPADDDRDGVPAAEEDASGEQRSASVGEPLNTDNGTPLSEAVPQETPEERRPQEQTDVQEAQEPSPPPPTEGADEEPGASEQEESSTERPPAEEAPVEEAPPLLPEFRYAEVAGVGCAPNERIAYGTAGEFWHGDGTDSWAFGFEGGFTQENCDGRWHAVPVSGDPDQPNGRYAFWTFNIGFTGARCDIYVHIPDAESPRWVGGAPAQYRLHPSADPATSEPFASFTVDQVADKGGWVHVGSYTPPGDTISVKLQNSGTDRIDGQDTNAHVVASAVRTRCN